MSFLEIQVIGRLVVTELLLLIVIPWLWREIRPLVPKWFLILWAAWLVAQVVTDLAVGSAPADFARGWAGIVFTLIDFAAIAVLASTPRRARLFATGLACGGFLTLAINAHPNAAADPWKWGIALPLAYLVASVVSGRLHLRWPMASVGAFGAFGILNLLLGFRSLAGISFLTACYLALSHFAAGSERLVVHSPRRAMLGLGSVALAGALVLGLYGWTASLGVLGAEAQRRYEVQGGAFGVLLGGRPEVLVSTQAILDSPLLGHGSWPKDARYAALLAERQKELGYGITPDYVGAEVIPAHSYLLGAWVWSGLPGALFWFAVAAAAAWLVANLYLVRIALAPLLVFGALLLLWDIAFSPYGIGARVSAAYQLNLCLLGLKLAHVGPSAESLAHHVAATSSSGSPAPIRENSRSER